MLSARVMVRAAWEDPDEDLARTKLLFCKYKHLELLSGPPGLVAVSSGTLNISLLSATTCLG